MNFMEGKQSIILRVYTNTYVRNVNKHTSNDIKSNAVGRMGEYNNLPSVTQMWDQQILLL